MPAETVQSERPNGEIGLAFGVSDSSPLWPSEVVYNVDTDRRGAGRALRYLTSAVLRISLALMV